MIVDFETHFYTQQLYDYVCKRKDYPYYKFDSTTNTRCMMYAPNVIASHGDILINNLLEIGQHRIKKMDAAGLSIQVLSLSEPSVGWMTDTNKAIRIAQDSNDVLASTIKQFPERFRGFAAIAPQDVHFAIRELERCIKKMGFLGWLTHSNYGPNKYLDDKRYWPILEAVESLNIPIYLHPLIPAIDVFYKYGFSLAGPALGFQFDTALCLMRMILAGVFDQFPRLRIMMGHLGETIPFLMERLDFTFVKPWFDKEYRPNLQRKPSEVLRENIFVTVSGRYYEPALKFVIEAMGSDHVLFATDYPYEDMHESVSFINDAKIPVEVRDKIFHKNSKQFMLVE